MSYNLNISFSFSKYCMNQCILINKICTLEKGLYLRFFNKTINPCQKKNTRNIHSHAGNF